MAIIARPSTRGPAASWDTSATTPSERLVASAPLPPAVLVHLAGGTGPLTAHLARNPWLPREAFAKMYRKGVETGTARSLLARCLTSDEVTHVLYVTGERRLDMIEAVLQSGKAEPEQQVRAAKRVRNSGAAERLLQLPLHPSAKEVLLGKVNAVTAVTYASNFPIEADDDTVWSWALDASGSDLPQPDDTPLARARTGRTALVGALVRLLHRRPHLVARIDESAPCALSEAGAVASRRSVGSKVAKSTGTVGTAAEAWALLDVAVETSADVDATAQCIVTNVEVLAEWCGAPAVTAAAGALVAKVTSTAQEGLFEAFAVPSSDPGARHSLSARNGFDAARFTPFPPAPEIPPPPGVREAEELLSSLVGGGSSWGATPAQVGAVLSATLGDDPFTWDVLLGLCDSFVGTVREMVAVTKATVSSK